MNVPTSARQVPGFNFVGYARNLGRTWGQWDYKYGHKLTDSRIRELRMSFDVGTILLGDEAEVFHQSYIEAYQEERKPRYRGEASC